MAPRLPGGEFGLIDRLFAPLSRSAPGAFNLKNDGALVTPPDGTSLVVTKDLMVAGVHYPLSEDPSIIARRLLRVNLSDLAAMGATALSYALGLALPREIEAEWLDGFVAGLALDQEEFGIALIGGDTVATTGPTVLSLTAFGAAPADAIHTRAGAGVGDDIFVSGTIGDGVLGLRVVSGELRALSENDQAELAARFRLPQPRLALGEALRGIATCAIDVSDGLIADLGHLCEESGVAGRVSAGAVPLSDAARRALASPNLDIGMLLGGGDDYELLFCAAPAQRPRVEAVGRTLGIPLTHIGTVSRGTDISVIDDDGRQLALEQPGYQHF
jgi:thiamine-monophosphate kinase